MSMFGQGRNAIDQVNDPKKAVRGFVVIPDLNRTQVPLVDYQENTFIPSDTNPFGLIDIVSKNEGTVTGQLLLFCGDTQVTEWHIAPGTSLMLSFNGMLVFNDVINAETTEPPTTLTVVGVQN